MSVKFHIIKNRNPNRHDTDAVMDRPWPPVEAPQYPNDNGLDYCGTLPDDLKWGEK